jgi:hypothetical protein
MPRQLTQSLCYLPFHPGSLSSLCVAGRVFAAVISSKSKKRVIFTYFFSIGGVVFFCSSRMHIAALQCRDSLCVIF